jgi:hypothetical protein
LARLPGHSEGGPIEIVHDFTDLGSNITVDGEIRDEVKCRIGKAARAFGCLQRSIFQNRSFSTETKQRVYRATVLSVLLYGAETWTTKTESMRQLNGFHNRCVRTIMGITKYQQWKEKITSKRLAAAFGMERDNDTPLDEASPEVAWSPSPYGALSHAQATPFWRVREEEA